MGRKTVLERRPSRCRTTGGRLLLSLVSSTLVAGILPARLQADSAIRFRDASKTWAIDFRHHHGGSGERYMVETSVGGVVIFDYDLDGDPDLFFVDGGVLPGYRGPTPRSVLLRNDEGPDGETRRFTDITDLAGIEVDGYGSGAVAGDADGDGDLDLYVTAYGRNQLLRNQGDGTFADITEPAGVGETRWSMGASFADVDLDGDLDLFVTNYVAFSVENRVFCGIPAKNIRAYCHPSVYPSEPVRFYRNTGRGEDGVVRFEDATATAGFGEVRGKGLGVLFTDLSNDGYPDLYVANDTTPNFVFLNRGANEDGWLKFEDVSLLSGASHSDQGQPEAGMGVDSADVDGDGFFDLVVTNFELETNALYKNEGEGLFTDIRYPAGIAEPSLLKLAFGVAFADFDHDGDEDLVVGNGHTNDNVEEVEAATPYKQPNQIFEKDGRRFREVKNAGLDAVRSSRGLAVGDLDLDGDRDILIVNSNDLTEVYENISEARGGWLAVSFLGGEGNPFGVGARAELRIGEKTTRREVKTGSSFLSQNELSLHFGTGQATRVDELTIRWADGRTRRIRGLPVNRRLRIP